VFSSAYSHPQTFVYRGNSIPTAQHDVAMSKLPRDFPAISLDDKIAKQPTTNPPFEWRKDVKISDTLWYIYTSGMIYTNNCCVFHHSDLFLLFENYFFLQSYSKLFTGTTGLPKAAKVTHRCVDGEICLFHAHSVGFQK
jgi:hypothetical protein